MSIHQVKTWAEIEANSFIEIHGASTLTVSLISFRHGNHFVAMAKKTSDFSDLGAHYNEELTERIVEITIVEDLSDGSVNLMSMFCRQ